MANDKRLRTKVFLEGREGKPLNFEPLNFELRAIEPKKFRRYFKLGCI